MGSKSCHRQGSTGIRFCSFWRIEPMRIKYLIMISLLFLFGLIDLECRSGHLPAIASGENAEPLVGEGVQYLITEKVVLPNNQKAPISGELLLPKPGDDEPFQKVTVISCDPHSEGRKIDEYGNILLRVPFRNIAPGKSFCARMVFRVNSRHLLWRCEAEKIPKKIPGPEKYREASEQFPTSDALVTSTLKRVLGREEHPYYQSLKIYDFVRGLSFKLTGEPKPVIRALKEKVVQCSDAVALFITLCRAAGIPTRYVGGIFCLEDKDAITQSHSWAEIYLPPYGWVPVDPTLGRFNDGSRLSCFAERTCGYVILSRERMSLLEVVMGNPGSKSFSHKDIRVRFSYKREKVEGRSSLGRELATELSLDAREAEPPISVDAQRVLTQADLLLQQKKYTEAEKILRRSLAAEPGALPLHRELVEVYQSMGRLKGLEAEYKALLSSNMHSPESYFGLGVIATYNEEYSRAFDFYRRAAELGADGYLLHNSIGFLYLVTKQYPQALREMSRALAFNPCADATLSNLVDLFGLLEDWAHVEKLCRLTIERLQGGSPVEYFQGSLCLALIQRGKYSEAQDTLEKLIRSRPDFGWYHTLLGWSLIEQGKTRKGKAELREGLKIGTEDREFFEKLLRETE